MVLRVAIIMKVKGLAIVLVMVVKEVVKETESKGIAPIPVVNEGAMVTEVKKVAIVLEVMDGYGHGVQESHWDKGNSTGCQGRCCDYVGWP